MTDTGEEKEFIITKLAHYNSPARLAFDIVRELKRDGSVIFHNKEKLFELEIIDLELGRLRISKKETRVGDYKTKHEFFDIEKNELDANKIIENVKIKEEYFTVKKTMVGRGRLRVEKIIERELNTGALSNILFYNDKTILQHSPDLPEFNLGSYHGPGVYWYTSGIGSWQKVWEFDDKNAYYADLGYFFISVKEKTAGEKTWLDKYIDSARLEKLPHRKALI